VIYDVFAAEYITNSRQHTLIPRLMIVKTIFYDHLWRAAVFGISVVVPVPQADADGVIKVGAFTF
jgi:hypothetical protein